MSHGTRSASQTHRNRICPGSARMIEALGQVAEKVSVYATEGEEKHETTNRILAGEIVDSVPSQDVLDTVAEVRDIEEVVRNAYGDFIVLTEVQVDLSELGFDMTENNNRIDRLLIVEGVGCVVIDYKYGVRYVPPAAYNEQLKAYAWGALKQYGGGWVWGHVIQPNTMQGEIATEAKWDAQQILTEIGPELAGINKQTREPNAPLTRGRHCDYCDARDISCHLHRGAVLSIPSHVPVEAHILALDPDARSYLYEDIKAALAWITRAKKAVEEVAIQNSIELGQHEVGTGRGSREWRDEEGAQEALFMLAKEAGFTTDDLYKFITPAQAEELFGKAKRIKSILEPLIEKKDGKPALVRRKAC